MNHQTPNLFQPYQPFANGGPGLSTWLLNACARVAADSAVTLSGTQTIDGVALVAGDWVLCTNQAAQSANGLYRVASGAWSRIGNIFPGMLVTIIEGDAYSNTSWMLGVNVTTTIILGTTPLPFFLLSSKLVSDIDWCVIKQNSAGTSFYQPSTIEAFSNTEFSYEGSSNSTKTIISFDLPIQPDGGGGNYAIELDSGGLMQAISSFLEVGSGVYNLVSNFRVRAIIAPYSIISATWTSFFSSPPAMSAILSLPARNTISVDINTGTTVVLEVFARMPHIIFSAYSTVNTIYGLVLDIEPETTKTGFTPAASSFAQFSASIFRDVNGDTRPKLVKAGR